VGPEQEPVDALRAATGAALRITYNVVAPELIGDEDS
jgi:hypothetical protein